MSPWPRWRPRRKPAALTDTPRLNAPAAPPPSTPARPGWLARTREGVGGALALALEGAASAGALVGVPVALVLGRVFLAVLLAAVGVGIFLRLTGRLRRRRQPGTPPPAPLPLWQHGLAALLSVVGVAVLVEATRLPVRHDQPGFTPANWLLVLLALAAGYALFTALAARLRRARPLPPSSFHNTLP